MLVRPLCLCALLCALSAWAKPPKLTLFISVDALGSDIYWRMKPRFRFGLAQVAAQGAFFPTTRYDYAETHTAPGHATLMTGANPYRHGVVSNKVLNRQTGKLEPVFADANHPALEAPLDVSDVSPANLMAETLADHLRLTTQGRGKAIALAGKGRAAIAMAGRMGQAWWFHEGTGRFVTGTYYLKEVPGWMKAFNDKKPADAYQIKDWPLLLPAKEYVGVDDRPYEADVYGLGRAFPHPLNGGLTAPGPQSYSALASSPFMNDLMVQAAKAAIDGEGLGKDDIPDLLAVSFSAFDRAYHLWGPYSWEVQDSALRLDKSVAELIALAERAAGGRANLVVVLSADHGGAAIPEELAAAGLEGVRVNTDTLKDAIKKELNERFKADLLLAIEETDVYLDWKTIAEKKLDLTAVRRAVASFLNKQPDVAFAIARDDLDAAQGPLAAVHRAGFFPERSGDVLMSLKPFRVLEHEPSGTSHGSPYTYDNAVPTFFLGKGVKPGFNPGPIRVVDVAPTAATLMEMGEPASCEGLTRAEALTSAPR